MIWLGIVIGFIVGALCVASIGFGGARYIAKHPEILMRFMAHKLVSEIKGDKAPIER